MKYLFTMAMLLSLSTFASDEKRKEAVARVKSKHSKILQDYRDKLGDAKNYFPNDEYEKFYLEWFDAKTEEEIKVSKEACEGVTPSCFTEEDERRVREYAEAGKEVHKTKNKLAKDSSLDEAQRGQRLREKASDLFINLCAQFPNKIDECQQLSASDKQKVSEAMKIKDSSAPQVVLPQVRPPVPSVVRIQPTPSIVPQTRPTLEEAIQRRPTLPPSVVRLSPDQRKPASPETTPPKQVKAEEKAEERPEVKVEGDDLEAKAKCQVARLNQLKTLKVTDLAAQEEKIISDHAKKWSEAKGSKCDVLLGEDRVAFSRSDAPDENEDEESPLNFNPDSCQWVNDLPRKVVSGPGCGKGPTRICTGYVICDQKTGGGKFIRMSTCGPEHCGGSAKDAVSCTKQPTYFSRKAKNEDKEFISSKLKKVITGAKQE